jgi:hypothetical protein
VDDGDQVLFASGIQTTRQGACHFCPTHGPEAVLADEAGRGCPTPQFSELALHRERAVSNAVEEHAQNAMPVNAWLGHTCQEVVHHPV